MNEAERRQTQKDVESLIEDHEGGFLTSELLVHVPFMPDKRRLEGEILRLSKMIDAEPNGERHTDMCAAFRALNWARNPDGFALPSECVLP